MSDVTVPYGKDPKRTATLLLGTATELGFDRRVVGTTRSGFVVPQEVYEMAYNLGVPNRNASKVAWVEYAQSQGANKEDAERFTRDELVEIYANGQNRVESEQSVPDEDEE